MFQRL